MSRTNTTRRTTLIFFAFGPVIGGLCMFAHLLAGLENLPALSEFLSGGMLWVVIFYIIGGYVVGAIPAAATGLLFGLVASRRALDLLGSILLGASAGLLTSAMAVAVIGLINDGAPKWNWIIPGIGALAGAVCGGYC
jgi:hypothetical protein